MGKCHGWACVDLPTTSVIVLKPSTVLSIYEVFMKKTDEWIYRYTNYFPGCLLFNLNLKSQFLHA